MNYSCDKCLDGIYYLENTFFDEVYYRCDKCGNIKYLDTDNINVNIDENDKKGK